MGWLAAFTVAVETTREIFGWKTGGRTLDENKDRDELQHWEEEARKALAAGDLAHANFARRRILRLHQRAIAKAP
jgi:hypothetical protein